MNLSDRQIGYLAGIIDGEGSFMITRNGADTYKTIQIAVSMCDRDTVQKLLDWTGYGSISEFMPNNGLSKKLQYRWRVRKVDDVVSIIEVIYPLLSERRRNKADELLAYAKIVQERRELSRFSRGSNSKLTESQVIGINHRLSDGEKPVDLGKEFSVDPKTIRDIASGRTWSHLTKVGE